MSTAKNATFGNVATFLAVLIAGYLISDTLLFHSGFYGRFLEPDMSATGYLERILSSEIHRAPSGKHEILIIGNSRIAEGFSAKLANQHTTADNLWYVNFGVSGTGNRVWYYLVRDVDPHRNRYAAIAVPIDDYDDPDDYEDVADRVGEMPLLVNRLRLTDILPYTFSFHTWKARLEVFRGLAFPAIVYQRDFQQFLEHPSRRFKRIDDFRVHGPQQRYDYGGMAKSLAGLSVDWAHRTITFPPGMPERQRQELTGTFFSQPPQKGKNRAFEMRWLGTLVDLYRGSQTRIILFQAPRSPAPRPVPLGHLPWTAVDELCKRSWVSVVDRRAFEGLEKPELFADHVHLNADGRQLFSPRLADAVRKSAGL
ncbi:MAG TPA: hypothetical protein VGL72_18580 [Bryobacteraceae bacterium]